MISCIISGMITSNSLYMGRMGSRAEAVRSRAERHREFGTRAPETRKRRSVAAAAAGAAQGGGRAD